MVPIFELSLRQLAGRWRLLIIFFLTSLPVGVTMIARAVGGDAPEDFIEGMFGGMIVGAIMPIVTMTLATAAFGNELEDRTLSYLLLKPVRRTFVAIPKMLASLVVAGPLLTASSVLVVVLALDGGIQTAPAVGVAVFAGVMAYSAVFTWAGLVSSHALGFALVYVFLWEGVISSFLAGVRYLSIRGYTLSIMYGLDEAGMKALEEFAIEFPAAIGGAVAVTAGFLWLTIRRLRNMDVP